MSSTSPAIKGTYKIFGYQVTLDNLCLEAVAWDRIRVLHLIRRRQAEAGPAEGTFNFAQLPLELFDKVITLYDAMQYRTPGLLHHSQYRPYALVALLSTL